MKILAEFLDELGIDDDAFRAIISFLQSTSRIVLPSLEMTDYVNNIGKNTSAEAPVFMENGGSECPHANPILRQIHHYNYH